MLTPPVAELAWRHVVEATGAHPEPPPQDPAPTWWLRSENEVVDFAGRTQEQDILRAWCDTEAPGAIALVTGEGGQGKTRLAQKVLADRQAEAWWVLQIAR
ncbi:MAG TPA: hypothetical protein VGK51_13395 [Actinomycetota bacterium]|jgi:hypothetical protein